MIRATFRCCTGGQISFFGFKSYSLSKPFSIIGGLNLSTTMSKDQFADLLSFSKKKDESTMSLQEIQRLRGNNSTPMSGGINGTAVNQWSNFDILDKTSSSIPSVNPSKADLFEGFDLLHSNSQSKPVNKVASPPLSGDLFEGFGQSNGSKNNDLLDSFDFKPAAISPSVQSHTHLNPISQPKPQNQDKVPPADDFDSLFSVFDTPPKPPVSQPVSRPVSQPTEPSQRQDHPPRKPHRPRPQQPEPQVNDDAFDQAMAELIDMGFTPEQSNSALKHAGVDVQAAVSYIMTNAHNKARADAGLPPERLKSTQNGTHGSEDYVQTFQKYMSGATKKLMEVQRKFMAPSPAETGVPAWMRDAEKYKAKSQYDDDPEEITTEELKRLALERERDYKAKQRSPAPGPRPQPQVSKRTYTPQPPEKPSRPLRSPSHQPEESHVDLFSPIPSKPKQQTQPVVDLFSDSSLSIPSTRGSNRSTPVSSSTVSKATPQPVQRPQISISSTQLEFFKDSKEQGGIAFKNGDFTSALQHYETSLSALPEGHVYQIVALSNVITCLIKTGENKRVLELSEKAIALIGPSKGNGEEIDGKSMKNFWIKVMTRRAEAFEHLEKFKDALDSYTLLIENGGATKSVMDGKKRCNDVLNPRPKSTAPSRPVSRQPAKAATPRPRVATPAQSSSQASDRIRETLQKESQFEDDRFKLHDVVEQKLNSWKTGKEDNLRALLSNLDTVLWTETQWKKVSMGDLVMPKKVKICYLKAVAKVHPDKIPPDATSEQKMLAEGIFVVLNTAWEGFKQQNGMN